MKTRERIDLELIDDNPWQPRQQIDQDALQTLAESMHQLGLLQAPLGRRVQSGRVQLAFGHSRVEGCRLLHHRGDWESHIDMDLEDLSDEAMAVMALTENVQRKQLTQIEVVKAHKRAIDETSLTVQDLAQQLGIDRSTVVNNLRVLELPDVVLEHVESGALALSAAREFLVLQNRDHAHTEDMRRVVDQIVHTYGRSGAPDWSRRHVRELIYDRVARNETEFRPLGPRPKHYDAGAAREATFDVQAFSAERPGKLHTIPASEGYGGKYELSRVWTCDVKAWRSRQTKATRGANAEAAVAAGGEGAVAPKSLSRDQQLQQLLAKDPVWKKISVSRETPGPDRPVTGEERERLGTRAEFRDLTWNTKFWKILQHAQLHDVRSWDSEKGGAVPPWFPDLKECQRCTIGAAYAKSQEYHALEKTKLVCFNQEHYQEKLKAGEAEYREKLEAQKKGAYRQDREAIQELIRQLQPLSEAARQVLARSLLVATLALELQHPLGVYHKGWSYESGAAARVRELLGTEETDHWGRVQLHPKGLEALSQVAPEDLRELVAALMIHHLRTAGMIETVSMETPPSPVENNGHHPQKEASYATATPPASTPSSC